MALIFSLDPDSAQFPSTNFPDPQVVHSTERRRVLAFTAESQACAWSRKCPAISGSLTAVVTYSTATETSGTVQWDVAVEADTVGTDSLDTDASTSYDTTNTHTAVTVPGTAGIRGTASITLSNADSLAEGDMVRFRLTRNTGGSTTGTIYFHDLSIFDSA